MSGGSHNYIHERIQSELVGQMKDPELDDLVKDLADLAHDLEWADSGDYSYSDYIESVKKFKAKWFGKSRNARLKEYIDKRLESVKEDLYSMIDCGTDN